MHIHIYIYIYIWVCLGLSGFIRDCQGAERTTKSPHHLSSPMNHTERKLRGGQPVGLMVSPPRTERNAPILAWRPKMNIPQTSRCDPFFDPTPNTEVMKIELRTQVAFAGTRNREPRRCDSTRPPRATGVELEGGTRSQAATRKAHHWMIT